VVPRTVDLKRSKEEQAMTISRISLRWPLLIVAVLTGLVSTSCAKDTPTTTPGAGGSAPASAAPATTPPPPVATGNPTDYCTLAERIATESGVMVNKHFIPLPTETLDMFKAVVNRSLAAKDQLAAGLPDNVKAAFLVAMQYFQLLKDSNYSAPPPAGFTAANKTVNDYGVSVCGFVFDK
jgi:hypothetical protein